MDAPLYLPSSAWEEPARLSKTLTVGGSSMGEFLADPVGRAILKSELPGLDTIVSIPQLKPHLSNLSPLQLSQIGGVVSADAVKRIEVKLKERGGAVQ